jgi:hypothetical protein
VANNDAALKREVSFEEGLLLAQMTNTTYYEISTERGTNCEDLFEDIANRLIDLKTEFRLSLI